MQSQCCKDFRKWQKCCKKKYCTYMKFIRKEIYFKIKSVARHDMWTCVKIWDLDSPFDAQKSGNFHRKKKDFRLCVVASQTHHQTSSMEVLIWFFCNITNCCKKMLQRFWKDGKCCKVNVARILALSKMLQRSCCKDFENVCNIHFSNVAKKKPMILKPILYYG